MGKITVNIAGKEYRIVSDESGEYVNQLAYTLNQQIAETAKSYVGVGNASITTLVALNLTDELQKSRAALQELEEQVRQMREALRKAEIELSMKTPAQPGENAEIRRLQEICQKLEEENRQLKQGHFKRKMEMRVASRAFFAFGTDF